LGKAWGFLFDGSPDTLVSLLKQPFNADPHATNSDSALPPGPEIVLFVLATKYHEDLPDGILSISELEELDLADECEEMTLYAFADEHYQSVDGISALNRPQLSGGH
jgi:hypothetical protein